MIGALLGTREHTAMRTRVARATRVGRGWDERGWRCSTS